MQPMKSLRRVQKQVLAMHEWSSPRKYSPSCLNRRLTLYLTFDDLARVSSQVLCFYFQRPELRNRSTEKLICACLIHFLCAVVVKFLKHFFQFSIELCHKGNKFVLTLWFCQSLYFFLGLVRKV